MKRGCLCLVQGFRDLIACEVRYSQTTLVLSRASNRVDVNSFWKFPTFRAFFESKNSNHCKKQFGLSNNYQNKILMNIHNSPAGIIKQILTDLFHHNIRLLLQSNTKIIFEYQSIFPYYLLIKFRIFKIRLEFVRCDYLRKTIVSAHYLYDPIFSST